MKRIGIITHYDVHNHGALLQLTALIKVLNKKGVMASALRFDKNYDFLGHGMKARYDISIRSIGIYLKYFMAKGLGRTLYNFNKHHTLNHYRKESSIIGDYYSESSPLDAVIVGSDEVFALHTGPTPVFFGHCLPTENVISYAGSFGPTTLDDIDRLHSRSLISSGLAGMKRVTVRDANSAEIVETLTGKKPDIVVDPVLLYGFQDEIASLPKVKKPDYLLIYSYDNRLNSPEEINAIKAYARQHKLKTLSAGFYHSWCDFNVDVDPINLLAYFRDAQAVVTDTFHGAVISIITSAKLAVKTRESNHLKLSNLLNEYRLESRLITNWNQLPEIMESPIDKASVESEVNHRRKASMSSLDAMLDTIL
ncbi:MAG: polysaccharide pyruvyl transferase family protein [Bacteroides sp.]|nr:polysaccharide pyruvyl transferase family protein [Bacteroides sp.]